MIAMIRALLARAYWRFQLARAHEFVIGLEQTIAAERLRADDALNYAEMMLARAEIDVIRARADNQLAKART